MTVVATITHPLHKMRIPALLLHYDPDRWSTNKSPTPEKYRRYYREDQIEQIITQLDATKWRIATIASHLFDHECK